MRRVHIVTDSTADLPADVADQLDIAIVPLKVLFGEEALRDGVDLSNEQFYRRLVNERASTSQPSPAEFLEVYRALTAAGDSVISLHISARLSGTVQSATLARSMMADAPIDVIDTRLTSTALALIVLAAAQAAAEGADHAAVLALCRRLVEKTHVYFMVDTLEYLQRGGRIGPAQAFLGSILSIKPVLCLKDGVVTPVEKVRGRAKALESLVRIVTEARGAQGSPRCGVVWGNDAALRDQLLRQLNDALGEPPYVVCQAGAIIGSHVGPGVVGIAFHSAAAAEP
ncbi:MAG: DegV family protein [Bacillota bacterium]|nr:DegV family protein [Bacillota bacterium]